ncbi:malate/lactate/ureidoglycolate dehydrogenase [Azospirillum picis]|uniref:Oxidoreductase n=1 Tax=Azospirillum picis TaxID=488438 RepID=A0ABU0MM51_9PROT|nr:malate/lactate/ureidoglycolate dehydrogenase [Azospirillum picis]MBP2300580.1 putative oxidoreductase [Azospirillum picis]MDQ0534549.1 putative oxidoreductase [Azospirillum picis]
MSDSASTPAAGSAGPGIRKVTAEHLAEAVRRLLRAAGSDADEARIVADHLVEANLRGHDSHGVGMLGLYMGAIAGGFLRPNQHAAVIGESGPFLAVGGGNGYGQAIAREAMDIAIARARRDGLAALSLRDTHHIGRVGSYGEQCSAAGLVCIAFVNVASRPMVAPHDGLRARLGTNPICIAVPATQATPALVLDFATSAVAVGKCRVAMAKGQEMAPGLVLDAQGNPTRDPAVMFEEPTGALLPLGGHKGFGLALMCDVLAGALAAAMPGTPPHQEAARVMNNMFAIVFDPARGGNAQWADGVDDIVAYVRDTPAAAGTEGVLLPGEPERRTRAARLAEGIPLSTATIGMLESLCAERGVEVVGLLG